MIHYMWMWGTMDIQGQVEFLNPEDKEVWFT